MGKSTYKNNNFLNTEKQLKINSPYKMNKMATVKNNFWCWQWPWRWQ
ncbi:MAG: hypothetical protein ACQERB_12185 [Promethearchaeati archaeon]